jgi:hypothetical protein
VNLPKGAEVIAQRGSPDVLLIKTGTDAEGRDLGVVWRSGFPLGPPMYVAAIAKFGYWEPYEGSQGVLADIEKEIADASAKNTGTSSGDRGARGRRRAKRPAARR